MGSQPNLEQSV